MAFALQQADHVGGQILAGRGGAERRRDARRLGGDEVHLPRQPSSEVGDVGRRRDIESCAALMPESWSKGRQAKSEVTALRPRALVKSPTCANRAHRGASPLERARYRGSPRPRSLVAQAVALLGIHGLDEGAAEHRRGRRRRAPASGTTSRSSCRRWPRPRAAARDTGRRYRSCRRRPRTCGRRRPAAWAPSAASCSRRARRPRAPCPPPARRRDRTRRRRPARTATTVATTILEVHAEASARSALVRAGTRDALARRKSAFERLRNEARDEPAERPGARQHGGYQTTPTAGRRPPP